MPIRVTFEEQSSKMLLGGNNGQPDVNKESLKHFMLIQNLLHPGHHLHLLV